MVVNTCNKVDVVEVDVTATLKQLNSVHYMLQTLRSQHHNGDANQRVKRHKELYERQRKTPNNNQLQKYLRQTNMQKQQDEQHLNSQNWRLGHLIYEPSQTTKCPWKITVEKSQKVHFFAYNFNKNSRENSVNSCGFTVKFSEGHLNQNLHNVEICEDLPRISNIHKSSSNVVFIEVFANKNFHFNNFNAFNMISNKVLPNLLLKYEGNFVQICFYSK